MGINCGIVGLPNVGKSTIFTALTANRVGIENYPFCTIDPNFGKISVLDERLYRIAELTKSPGTVPNIIEFVDIAGLVKGASRGEGLGNQFLGHIRQVDAIVHVVRCFENENVAHVNSENIDPVHDIDTVEMELILADLEVVEKRVENIQKYLKSSDKELVKITRRSIPVLERIKRDLNDEKPLRLVDLSMNEIETIRDLNLLTIKPVLYVCNVGGNSSDNHNMQKVLKRANAERAQTIIIDGKLESEISLLPSVEEKKEFVEMMGYEESGLSCLVKASYKLLNLITYFTTNERETRAWTLSMGRTVYEAAGQIHTDFQRGFIRAEVISSADFFKYGDELKVRDAGKLRVEGRDYLVQDGDIIYIRFNV